MPNRLEIILICALLVGIQILGAFVQWRRAHAAQRPMLPARMPKRKAWLVLLSQVSLFSMFGATYLTGKWSAASVGLHAPLGGVRGFVLGALAYGIFAFAFEGSVKLLGIKKALDRFSTRANARLWPREASAKVAMGVALFVLNPFTEEMLMRGILVHQLALFSPSPALPIALGLVVNAVLHLYQGWRQQVFHTLFFALVTSLLYSPTGLAGSIGAHVIGDIAPIALLARETRRRARAWRARARLRDAA